MAYYQFNLKAGQPIQASVRGRLILVDDIGVASGLDITPMLANQEGRTMPARKKAFKFWTDYDALVLQVDVDTTVALFLSDTDVTLGFADGAAVSVSGEVSVTNGQVKVTNTVAERVPVEIGGSTVTVTADNVGVNNTDANPVPTKINNTDANPVPTKINNTDANAVPVRPQVLATITNVAPVAVGIAQTALVSDATLKKVIFRNAHATATVAIGPTGVTLANGAIQLAPGDTWIEEEAAGIAWFGISDTAGASIQMQGRK